VKYIIWCWLKFQPAFLPCSEVPSSNKFCSTGTILFYYLRYSFHTQMQEATVASGMLGIMNIHILTKMVLFIRTKYPSIMHYL
jgi:hypothetical protein